MENQLRMLKLQLKKDVARYLPGDRVAVDVGVDPHHDAIGYSHAQNSQAHARKVLHHVCSLLYRSRIDVSDAVLDRVRVVDLFSYPL